MDHHERDLLSVREATERLLAAVGTLDNAAVTHPSRLPGWTRGHVLAHLARNADALVNVLDGRPMYASAEARDADIEQGAPRDLDAHLADVRESAERFQHAGAQDADWSRTVELRNGVKDVAARIPFRRWAEVELHHVDLAIGYELEDLSEEFTRRETDFLMQRFRDHLPDASAVHGPPADLLGWLSGRRDGAALTVDGGGSLPALPPL
ncbi:maleylpyruvate isomerase family mycothiol-dependent enzyme [Streptomyces sp. NPDC046939]|uniref:maleylpyruvate isomerase family mycothiol-dependent enzyme n=1 Tax=Streptomyces sp. NPDC046939 TaxID=3155376 RepID=UPI0033EA1D34